MLPFTGLNIPTGWPSANSGSVFMSPTFFDSSRRGCQKLKAGDRVTGRAAIHGYHRVGSRWTKPEPSASPAQLFWRARWSNSWPDHLDSALPFTASAHLAVAVDGDRTVYVADRSGDRVVKLHVITGVHRRRVYDERIIAAARLIVAE